MIKTVSLLFFMVPLMVHGGNVWAPLNFVQPEKELVNRLQRQYHWVNDNSHSFTLEALTSGIEKYLSDDASKMRLKQANQTECIKSLVDFSFDLAEKKPYTHQVIDSDGKLSSGLLLGNLKWYGRYYQCLNAHGDSFDGKWCAAEVGAANSPYGGGNIGLNLGMCVPSTCPQSYIQEMLQPLASETKTAITVDCPVQPTEWRTVDILSFLLFISLVTLTLLGTVYDIILECKAERERRAISICGDGMNTEHVSVCGWQNLSAWSRAAVSFSLRKNTCMLFNTSPKPGNIAVLHGMRFLSIAWVTLGHTYVMTIMYIDNILDLLNWYMESFSFQTVGNATFSVDTFFFLSGLLVAYLGVREITRTNGKLNVPLMYLHRYIRLTPTYAFLIFVIVGFYNKLGDGPVWPQMVQAQADVCDKYWWTNLLYINNLHPSPLFNECFALGWYLANDMQFYLLAPISIYLFYKWPKAGIFTLVFGIFSSMLVTGVISTHFKEQAQPVGLALLMQAVLNPQGPATNGSFRELPAVNETSQTFWSDTYAKPWCRISVYLIGMMTGYVLYRCKCQMKMNKLVVSLGWVAAAFLNLTVVYGLWGHVQDATPQSVGAAALYNAVSRPVWALSLAWITIACTCGYGGPVNRLLSLKVFVPLSRLTYSIYLGHTIVISWWFSNKEVTAHYSNMDFAFTFVAVITVSIVFAYLLYMLVEAPLINLQKIAFSHRREANQPVEATNNPLLGDTDEDD